MVGHTVLSRHPAPPVILFKDADWAPQGQGCKLLLPDSRYLNLVPTEVTWYFEDLDAYTAEPYVAEVPVVDFLGLEDRKSKTLLWEAFHIYGYQLLPEDLETMEREGHSLMRVIDNIIKAETNDAENIYTRVFDRKKPFKQAGMMWLPFLDGTGLTAKLGRHSQPKYEPLPMYPGPKVEPPPYELVEDKAAAKQILEQPPSYEEAVASTIIIKELPADVSLEKQPKAVDTVAPSHPKTASTTAQASGAGSSSGAVDAVAVDDTSAMSVSSKWQQEFMDVMLSALYHPILAIR
ncbi:hypothetical protein F5Y15DRAFT_254969 [Xylariaceae sp. FL0016]|nr:hypothetical protein F5Y15DRAFT_254969 [Xylariaceae sp. FL0016]